jgi:hypothetical protein
MKLRLSRPWLVRRMARRGSAHSWRNAPLASMGDKARNSMRYISYAMPLFSSRRRLHASRLKMREVVKIRNHVHL